MDDSEDDGTSPKASKSGKVTPTKKVPGVGKAATVPKYGGASKMKGPGAPKIAKGKISTPPRPHLKTPNPGNLFKKGSKRKG